MILSSDDETAAALARAINPQALVRTTPADLLGVRLHDPDTAETWVEPGAISAPLQDGGRVRTLEWHPEHGDRATYLSITGIDLDIWELERRLDGCVLRADESAGQLTDPFAPYLEGSAAA
ncbi:hypothetical protein [Kribbella qitaiheensis]|uniref:hypothetical protein n=1 Tax=Kribbella qitaiheensis TaxID=1544730 RepID=UPI0016240A3F|nr:hypothetical protein [Kribbella qitaiheensis]